MNKNIVLCGFMGSGKSTVGRMLAKRLSFSFADSDELIEQRCKMSISEIFEAYSEEYFREKEKEVIAELSQQNQLVIATGGGSILNKENYTVLKSTSIIFFLDVTSETVIYRLSNDLSRPLLQKENKESAINKLLLSRFDIYSQAADYIVDANGDPESVVKSILSI